MGQTAAGRGWIVAVVVGIGCGCGAFLFVFHASEASPADEVVARGAQAGLDSSRACGASGCHPNIVRQWESSPHRHSGNWFYRRALGNMDEAEGANRVKECGACHDPVTAQSGAAAVIGPETVQEGIACVVCHRMGDVGAEVGGGQYTLRPAIFYVGEPLNAYTAHVERGKHREDFSTDTTEVRSRMCGVCHQWHAGMAFGFHEGGISTYLRWAEWALPDGLASVASGFMPDGEDCVGCHMPRDEEPDRPGRQEASHRFASSNLNLAHLIGDEEQAARIGMFASTREGHAWEEP